MTKMMNKMGVLGLAFIVMVLAISIHTSAFAKENNGSDNSEQSQEIAQQQNDNVGERDDNSSNEMMRGEANQLRVESNGNFKASGLVVNANSGTTLSVKFFGINFNIQTGNARVEGGATTTLTSDIAAGDKLSVDGTIDQTTGVISAQRIVDSTLAARWTGDVQSRIADLMKLVQQLQEQLRQMGQ